VQNFVETFKFAICGLIMKTCGFATLESCGFSRAEWAQELAALRTKKKFACPHLFIFLPDEYSKYKGRIPSA
jgi:hypothetical protein